MIFKLALRELLRSWRFGLFFIFNLSLGLTGFVTLEAFNNALTQQIHQSAKDLLSADLAITSRRELTESELAAISKILPSPREESKIYEFFAMATTGEQSRLVMLKGIDQSYPFYGELKFKTGTIVSNSTSKDIIGADKVWIYPELQSQMGLKVGDRLKVGQLDLEVSEIVEKDSTQSFRSLALAPRIYVDRALLPQSGLLQYGSTFSVMQAYRFAGNPNPEELKKQVFSVIKDPAVNVATPENAGEASSRQLGHLSDYLGLVAIVALFMSALGASYIYRLFILRRMKEIAILRSLGLQSFEAVGVYVLQASMLGILTLIPTLLISSLVLPGLSKLLASFTPFDLQPQMTLSAVLIGLLMAVLGSFLVSLPFLLKIFDLRPAKLFSEEKFSEGQGQQKWWAFLPLVALFYFLAVYQANSIRVGSIFVVAMVTVTLGMLVLGWAIVKLVRIFRFSAWYRKYSFLGLSRRAGSSLSIFVALGLGALLINILPQVKSSLQAEFQLESGSKVPSLFMFDIQDEQVEPLEQTLTASQVEAIRISPMVRARILKINDQDYERTTTEEGFKTREEEQDARTRNRGVNLSYREDNSGDEQIVSGRPFSGDYDFSSEALPEISLERNFARRMGLKIGDTMMFDIQGVEISGKVVNLRKVKWTTFEPNFFITMQNGVLNEAPKTFIAAIPAVSEEIKYKLQNELSVSLPNVSIIDVARTVDETLQTAEKMSWSLELMAGLTLITGYIVLFSIVRTQIRSRRWELNMLKILGAERNSLVAFILSEFGYLSLCAAVAGAGLSLVVSFSLSAFVFQSAFVLNLWSPLFSVVAITAISMIISLLACLDIVNESALGILRGES